MSRSTYQRASRSPSPPRTGDNILLGNLLKVASLAAQAHSNPKFVDDQEFALGIMREAHTMTTAWLADAREEVEHLGLLDRFKRGEGSRPSKKSAGSWLLILAKVAAMRWRESRRPRGADEGDWRRTILKEIYHHLEAHVGDAEDEIKRLEKLVKRKYRKHEKQVRSNGGDVDATKEGSEMVDQFRGDKSYDGTSGKSPGLSHYRKQRGDKRGPEDGNAHKRDPERSMSTTQYTRLRSRRRRGDRERSASRDILVHDCTQMYPSPQVHHPVASVAGSFDSESAHTLLHDDQWSSQQSLQSGLVQEALQDQTNDALPPSDVTANAPYSASFSHPVPRTVGPEAALHAPQPSSNFRHRSQSLASKSLNLDGGSHTSSRTHTCNGAPRNRNLNAADQSAANLDARNNHPTFESTQMQAPYEHPRTASMPKTLESISSSQYSRETRAPTVSSVQSNPATITGPAAPSIVVAPASDSTQPPENTRSRSGVHHMHSDSCSRASNRSSKVPSARDRSDSSRTNTTKGGSQARGARSAFTTSQYPHYPDTPILGTSAKPRTAYDAGRTPEQNSTASSITPKPSRGGRGSQYARTTPPIVSDNAIPQPLPAQAPPAWGFESLNEPRVRSPSGMSCHAGSRNSSGSSRYVPSHTTERSGSKTRKQGHTGSGRPGAGDAVSNVDSEDSKVSSVGYKRPQRTKKCHHDPPDEYCDSTTTSSQDQGSV